MWRYPADPPAPAPQPRVRIRWEGVRLLAAVLLAALAVPVMLAAAWRGIIWGGTLTSHDAGLALILAGVAGLMAYAAHALLGGAG